MRIGVDAREIQDGTVTGIGRSLENFIRYFGRHDRENELILFSERPLPPGFKGRVKNVVIGGSLHTLYFDQVALAGKIKSEQIDLFYSPYYKVPLFTGTPVISQVLDLMYLVLPEYKKKLGHAGRFYHHLFGRLVTRKAVSIITDSRHAGRDIVRLWGVAPEKISIIPLGVAERYRPLTDQTILEQVNKRWGLPERFVLYLGNFKPHKNVRSLVVAFKTVKSRMPRHKLVLAGPLDDHGKQIQAMVNKEGLADRVVFTDTIREKDRPEALLTLAELFVFPSLYEGFGIPPLEAMACGTPVIASNRTAIPETVGEAAVIIDPMDINALSGAMMNMVHDPELRKECARKGLERAKLFTEEKTAGELYRHIITVLEAIK